jgi:hypothetical protein
MGRHNVPQQYVKPHIGNTCNMAYNLGIKLIVVLRSYYFQIYWKFKQCETTYFIDNRLYIPRDRKTNALPAYNRVC